MTLPTNISGKTAPTKSEIARARILGSFYRAFPEELKRTKFNPNDEKAPKCSLCLDQQVVFGNGPVLHLVACPNCNSSPTSEETELMERFNRYSQCEHAQTGGVQ
jgi:hypothetical protein